jgi:hypothetical protein
LSSYDAEEAAAMSIDTIRPNPDADWIPPGEAPASETVHIGPTAMLGIGVRDDASGQRHTTTVHLMTGPPQ